MGFTTLLFVSFKKEKRKPSDFDSTCCSEGFYVQLGCLASAWARLATDIGEVNATLILEKECGHKIPQQIIEVGLQQKARFAHLS